MNSRKFSKDFRDRRAVYLRKARKAEIRLHYNFSFNSFRDLLENKKFKALFDWYDNHLLKTKELSSLIEKRLGYLIVAIVLIIAYGLVGSIYLFHNENYNIGYFCLGFFVCLPCLLLGLHLLNSKKKSKELMNNIKKGNLVALSKNEFPPLEEIMIPLLNKMNISEDKIIVLKSRSNTYFPSVETHNSKEYLILPINFFLLCLVNKKEAEALLAHEFGHILQADTKVWLLTTIFSNSVYFYFFPYFIFLSILLIVFSLSFSLLLLRLFIPIIFFTYLWVSKSKDLCIEGRALSEELADTAVILFSDGNSLIDALKKYTQKSLNRWNSIHPELKERISKIKEKLEKL